eukprot:3081296-Amphidinium_carterae.1
MHCQHRLSLWQHCKVMVYGPRVHTGSLAMLMDPLVPHYKNAEFPFVDGGPSRIDNAHAHSLLRPTKHCRNGVAHQHLAHEPQELPF